MSSEALSAKLHQMSCLAVNTASHLFHAVPESEGTNPRVIKTQLTAEERKVTCYRGPETCGPLNKETLQSYVGDGHLILRPLALISCYYSLDFSWKAFLELVARWTVCRDRCHPTSATTNTSQMFCAGHTENQYLCLVHKGTGM